LSTFYGQLRIQIQRFKDAETINKNEGAWRKQNPPEFPPSGFELVTDELLNEWHQLRLQYASTFLDKYIGQLQFVQRLEPMEEHDLPKEFVRNVIRSIKLRDKCPLSIDDKETRDRLRMKSIKMYDTPEDRQIPVRNRRLWCPVAGKLDFHCFRSCAHIIPLSCHNVANYIFGDPMHLDTVNRPENTIHAHSDVQHAMDHGWVAFAPVEAGGECEATEFRMVIVDPSILEEWRSLNWLVSVQTLNIPGHASVHGYDTIRQ
jgi:hypothetical protein